jgi:ADP-glucose pyrophosphorylase
VPFNGKHRIVDFVLSNLVNSEIYSTYLLVQYKSQSLIEHVRQSWTMARFIPQHFITVVPPQMRNGPEWFQGTADAVYQNIHLIESFKPDIVAVFGADHIYRMDVRQMINFHIQSGAHASVATATTASRSSRKSQLAASPCPAARPTHWHRWATTSSMPTYCWPSCARCTKAVPAISASTSCRLW